MSAEQIFPGRPTRPPVPDYLSDEARAYLSALPPVDPRADNPAPQDPHDPEQWRAMIAGVDAFTATLYDRHVDAVSLEVASSEREGVKMYELVPSKISNLTEAPLFLEFHGGALFSCGGELAWKMAALSADSREGITWAPDYRMPPDAPYPAALDDAMSSYRAALNERQPSDIVVVGTSAGGNLAAALLLRAKDENLPMPAALVLNSPEIDLTESGDSFHSMQGIDAATSLMHINRLYAAGRDLEDPYLSPLFGDVTGFPPTIVWAGTRDFLLSNSARFHRKLVEAGVPAELHLVDAMPHSGFGGLTPEDRAIAQIVRNFERRALADARTRA